MKKSSESMLVRLENLNRLLEVAGDVIINASNMEHAYKNIQGLYEKSGPLDEETLNQVRELSEAASRNGEHLHNLVQAIRTVGLQDLVFRARRTVREAGRKTGKRVRLDVQGVDTNLDKTIVEALFDPLSHQVRNAVTHGIESSAERVRLGKPEEGVITFKASKNETDAFIEIADDGAGIDLPALGKLAAEQGLFDPKGAMTVGEALNIICRPGFTTATRVSETHGRGVGMDVVRERIEALGGTVQMETKTGVGTRFTYQIPLVSAVNILDALVVRADDHYYAFPIINVVATLAMPTRQVKTTMERERVIKYLGNLISLFDLNEIIDPGKPPVVHPQEAMFKLLIVEHKGDRLALRVNEFREPQKLVIIPFGGGLFVRGLSGTTVLGGKNLGFVIDVPSFMRRAFGKPEPSVGGTRENVAMLDVATTSEEAVEEAVTEEYLDAGEHRSEYLVEAEKILASLNESLFSMGTDASEEQVNEAFRYFHTIKGNMAMMQLPKTVETIHAVETVLNRVRDRHMPFGDEVMDIMMDGVSFAEDVLSRLKRDNFKDTSAGNILSACARLLPQREAGTLCNVDATELQPDHAAIYRASVHTYKGTPKYRVRVVFEKGPEPAFLRGILIYKRLCEVGDVLASVPSLDEIQRGLVADRLKFLLASEVEADRLTSSLSELLKAFYGVKTFELEQISMA